MKQGKYYLFYIFLFILLLMTFSLQAQQLKLGNDPTQINPSAVLQLDSRNQGLLLTRVPDTSLLNVILPPDGMIIYFTDGKKNPPYGTNAGVYQRINNSWQQLLYGTTHSAWLLGGNTGTQPGTNFIGTTDNKDLYFKTHNNTRLILKTSGMLETQNPYLSVMIGYQVGENLDANNLYNVFIGYRAGRDNTDGDNNVFIGRVAGKSNKSGAANTFIGGYSGWKNTEGKLNAFVGFKAGIKNTTGYNNTFLGAYSGKSVTSGYGNTFVGEDAGYKNVSGNHNVFVGRSAGQNEKGDRNTYVGTYAGSFSSNGTNINNSFFGYSAGGKSKGSYNTFIGMYAGRRSKGDSSTFVGAWAGRYAEGDYNNFLGFMAGYGKDGYSTGNKNVFNGYKAGYNYTSGSTNTFLGYKAGYNNKTGNGNVAVGKGADMSNDIQYGIALGSNAKVEANSSVAIGAGVVANKKNTIILGNGQKVGVNTNDPEYGLDVNSTGYFSDSLKLESSLSVSNGSGTVGQVLTSQGIGNAPKWENGGGNDWYLSGNSITGGNFLGTTNNQPLIFKANGNQVGYFGTTSETILLGNGATVNASSKNSIAIGHNAKVSTSYYGAIAIGFDADAKDQYNIAIGRKSVTKNSNSIALGNQASASSVGNVAIGDGATTKANYSTALGKAAKANKAEALALGYKAAAAWHGVALGAQSSSSGDKSIALGYNTSTPASNAVAIGSGVTANKKRTIILGDGQKVGVNTNAPGYELDVNGAGHFSDSLEVDGNLWAHSIKLASDIRYKKHVKELKNVLALLDSLHAYTYFFRVKEFKDKNFPNNKQIGMIAQEIEQYFPELVSTNQAGYKSLNYAQFTAVLLEAVKEQQAEIKSHHTYQKMNNKKIQLLEQQVKLLKQETSILKNKMEQVTKN